MHHPKGFRYYSIHECVFEKREPQCSDNAEWVLMDYVSIVVHVFQKEIREYYNIEGLWGDAKITTIANNY